MAGHLLTKNCDQDGFDRRISFASYHTLNASDFNTTHNLNVAALSRTNDLDRRIKAKFALCLRRNVPKRMSISDAENVHCWLVWTDINTL